ncbi:DUF7289 family protein [Natronosalvus rutilus]|uniref:DUF7305 domain-containing protein n=1 Tax=Natronosalvus rutilus TaxID=2953753 RepID=A0A9E7SW83_9EURY|nr:hypothetical protein [Natronosalvus rutilus]UTF54762.1 hypothetical protein NGM29_05695 [Natronosalvus rutilus]
MNTDTRAVTPVLGLVLLIGIVAISSLTIMAVGTDLITATQNQAEDERAEQSFVELKQAMTSQAQSPETTHSISLGVSEGGTVIRDDAGSIQIEYEDLDAAYADPIQFGAVEYRGHGGSVVALEAGAVFRGTGEDARMVSKPKIEYDDEENALNYHLMEAVGEKELRSDELQLNVTAVEGQNHIVENQIVVITIESRYWGGWEQYFTNEVGDRGVIAEPIPGSDKGKVTVNLGRIDRPTPFENAVHAREDPNLGGNANISGEVTVGDSLDPIDDEITALVANATANYTHVGQLDGGTVTAGTYYADEIDLSEELVVDLTDGDVVLVVDGDIHIDHDFRVKNWGDNDVQLYTTGDLSLSSSQMCLDENTCRGTHSDRQGNDPGPGSIDAEHLQVYGTSDFQLEMAGHTYFEGIIYAPAGDHGSSNVGDWSGNAYLDGSVVLGAVDAGGTPMIAHHEALKWLDPQIGQPVKNPEITYLNLIYQEIEVTNK